MAPVDWGVNYRALHDLFSTTQSRLDVFRYEIGVQMLEIYNEQVRDLLAADGVQKKYPFDTSLFLRLETCLISFTFMLLFWFRFYSFIDDVYEPQWFLP